MHTSTHFLLFNPAAEAVKSLVQVDMTDDCRQKLAGRLRQVETGATEQENLGTYRWKGKQVIGTSTVKSGRR